MKITPQDIQKAALDVVVLKNFLDNTSMLYTVVSMTGGMSQEELTLAMSCVRYLDNMLDLILEMAKRMGDEGVKEN